MPVDEVSIGDYVLAGGEVAVLVMVEAVGRLLPGVLGNAESARRRLLRAGPHGVLLEGPVYTKPPVWRGRDVPEVLLSGHHGAIARWRRDEALRRTAAHRPELLARSTPEAGRAPTARPCARPVFRLTPKYGRLRASARLDAGRVHDILRDADASIASTGASASSACRP